MKNLALALYAEGVTDQRFLPDIIRRTSRRVLDQHDYHGVSIEPIELLAFNKIGLRQEQCILQAAHKAINYHVLIVHADADHRTNEKALRERFRPGYDLVQNEENVCKHLVPIIPVQMTEAWMLADHEALQEVIGTSTSPQELGLPTKTRQVEADPNPKQTLNRVLQKAYAHHTKRRRQNQTDVSTLYTLLGRSISLERLNLLSAYQQFVNDLTATLKKLNFIQ